MTVRSAWLLPTGQTREDTRAVPLGTMAPASTLTSRDGLIAGGAPFAATGTGMQVTIGTGRAIVQGTTTQGAYPVAITSAEVLTVGDGNAQFGRIDSVILHIYDGAYDTSGTQIAAVELLVGAPAASPSAPTLPAGCLRLWDITVPAGASAGTGGLTWSTALADRRRYTSSYGGIIPAGYGLNFAGTYEGQYRDNGSGLERWSVAAGAWQAYPSDTGWQTISMTGGWTAYVGGTGGTAMTPQARVMGGVVYLRGRLVPPATYTSTITSTGVPAAARPPKSFYFTSFIGAGAAADVAVSPVGSIVIYDTGSASVQMISLDGISYPAT